MRRSLCVFCKDIGLTFDEFNHHLFCSCHCGIALATQEPNHVLEAYVAYVKVMRIPTKWQQGGGG